MQPNSFEQRPQKAFCRRALKLGNLGLNHLPGNKPFPERIPDPGRKTFGINRDPSRINEGFEGELSRGTLLAAPPRAA